ncbi:MAG: dynamin family protein [Pseudomonadota bacterium]
MSDLAGAFERFCNWRTCAAEGLLEYSCGMDAAGVGDRASHDCLAQLRARLADDKLTIAFVAEFSRGKSELINAIFFADYGQRIVPSSAGRTTMCPTELRYDATSAPCIRLLPIETRAQAGSIGEFQKAPESWTTLPLELESVEAMQEAFRQVGLTKRVPVGQAVQYGLFDADDPDAAGVVATDGTVEISAWRHAIVNFPHPLLKQGLVIIDTPGLNAIGTEPDLTLHLIPSAHVVLFVLGADTGVTKSDLALWRDNLGGRQAGRVVVMNKIDSLWDELRTPLEIDAEIQGQAKDVAQALGLASSQVFPVSAQKGLLAKIRKDSLLLQRSRLPTLEQALSAGLIPARQMIVRDQLVHDLGILTASRRALVDTRLRGVVEQLFELRSLRGKNQKIVAYMKKRIDIESEEFDLSLSALQATRMVLARLSAEMFSVLGMVALHRDIRHARAEMDRSYFSKGLRQAVRQFFEQAQTNLAVSDQTIEEINAMMTAMYRKFSGEHGLMLSVPMGFSLAKYRHEIAAIDAVYQQQFGTAAILTTSQLTLMQNFFNSIVLRVKQTFLRANQDVESWLQMLMSPLDAQINEHQAQLLQRRQSIERIGLATGGLEEKLSMLESLHAECAHRDELLRHAEAGLQLALSIQPATPDTESMETNGA